MKKPGSTLNPQFFSMKLFDVYPLLPINIIKAKNCKLWDENGTEYLDFYGGHAVISVGHSHPFYVQKVTEQLNQIGFYSNSIINQLQEEFAEKLGKVSGYEDYDLFLCNSGAEANENAFKIASFATGKRNLSRLKILFTVELLQRLQRQTMFRLSHQSTKPKILFFVNLIMSKNLNNFFLRISTIWQE